jgi:flavin reductase (DIM6/NTAB) family NADH-FMN oxidoreductase RutF
MNFALKHPVEVTVSIFKGAMRQMAGGVSVITAGVDGERTGLTVTSAISLSMNPPTMIVCINRAASAWPVIRERRHFCVNALASHHRAVADRFAGSDGVKGAARYAGATWSALATGALALDDSIASIDCLVEEFVERHSHAIVIGVVRAVTARGGQPLLYSQGQYGAFAPPNP